jgi:uncharacterized protein (TIGR02246 family)
VPGQYVKSVLLGVALLIEIADAKPARAQAATPLSEQQLETQDAVRATFVDAYARGDLETLVALYDADATFGGTLQPFWLEGQDAIRDLWQRYFAAFPNRRLIFRQPAVRAYGDTTVVDTGYLEMYMEDENRNRTVTFIRYSITRVLADGRWLIANMNVAQLPGSR